MMVFWNQDLLESVSVDHLSLHMAHDKTRNLVILHLVVGVVVLERRIVFLSDEAVRLVLCDHELVIGLSDFAL